MFDETIEVPGVNLDAPTPKKGKAPASHSKEVLAALLANGDQPRCAEGAEMTITAGIRCLYVNVDGRVAVIPLTWVD